MERSAFGKAHRNRILSLNGGIRNRAQIDCNSTQISIFRMTVKICPKTRNTRSFWLWIVSRFWPKDMCRKCQILKNAIAKKNKFTASEWCRAVTIKIQHKIMSMAIKKKRFASSISICLFNDAKVMRAILLHVTIVNSWMNCCKSKIYTLLLSIKNPQSIRCHIPWIKFSLANKIRAFQYSKRVFTVCCKYRCVFPHFQLFLVAHFELKLKEISFHMNK